MYSNIRKFLVAAIVSTTFALTFTSSAFAAQNTCEGYTIRWIPGITGGICVLDGTCPNSGWCYPVPSLWRMKVTCHCAPGSTKADVAAAINEADSALFNELRGLLGSAADATTADSSAADTTAE